MGVIVKCGRITRTIWSSFFAVSLYADKQRRKMWRKRSGTSSSCLLLAIMLGALDGGSCQSDNDTGE